MKKSINKEISEDCRKYAPVDESRNFYNDLAEGIITKDEAKAFMKHVESCLYCSRKAVEAIKLHDKVRKNPFPYIREALRRQFEKRFLKKKD